MISLKKASLIFVVALLGQLSLDAQLLNPEVPQEDPPPTEKPQVFEGRAGSFEFVAADQASLQIARRIGRKVLDVCDDLLTPPLERIPVIDVKLAPDGHGNLEGSSHRLFQDIAGDYGLAVAWNENLSVALFTEALTESYLKQLVYTLSDRQRAEEVPPWLIAGASLRVQVALRPALVEYLKELGRNSPMVSLENLLNKRSLSELTPADRVASYWFIELARRQLDREKRIRNYFDTVVAGKPAAETLEQQSEDIRTFPNGIEGWWVIGFQDIVHRDNGIVLSLERTAKQLFILNRFELIDRGRPSFQTSTSLWELRENPVIQRAVSDRLRGIENVMPRANPVFYRAFGNLGLVFQSLLAGEREEYLQNSSDFEEELGIATKIAEEVLLLSDNPAVEITVSE